MGENPHSAAWKKEISALVERINKQVFTLADLYAFESELRKKFPNNRHIRDKIRQQLQFIREDGLIEFVDNQGTYRRLFESPEERKLLVDVISQIDRKDFAVTDRWGSQKIRMGVKYFRTQVLRNFQYCCCVCRFDIEPLLDAAHIVPWKEDSKNRLNPSNGLSFCRIHHGAFDIGLLKIGSDMMVRVSEAIRMSANESVQNMLVKYHGRKIVLPRIYQLLLKR